VKSRTLRSQSAIDFISSYGFALLIIAIAIYAVTQLGVFNYSGSPQYCYPDSPFSCVAYSVNSSGSLTILLSQSGGGIVTITGAACSGTYNTSKVGPKFGNANVLAYNTVTGSTYYPTIQNNRVSGGINIYPGGSAILYVKCYNSNLGPAAAPVGNTFTGFLWLNYTFSGLPNTYHYISRAAAINVKYIQ
jgi:hypothetical protein